MWGGKQKDPHQVTYLTEGSPVYNLNWTTSVKLSKGTYLFIPLNASSPNTNAIGCNTGSITKMTNATYELINGGLYKVNVEKDATLSVTTKGGYLGASDWRVVHSLYIIKL